MKTLGTLTDCRGYWIEDKKYERLRLEHFFYHPYLPFTFVWGKIV